MSRISQELVSIRGHILNETDRAVLVRLTHVGALNLAVQKEFNKWIPLSQVCKVTHPPKESKEPATILINKWWYDKDQYDEIPVKPLSNLATVSAELDSILQDVAEEEAEREAEREDDSPAF